MELDSDSPPASETNPSSIQPPAKIVTAATNLNLIMTERRKGNMDQQSKVIIDNFAWGCFHFVGYWISNR